VVYGDMRFEGLGYEVWKGRFTNASYKSAP